MSAHTGFTRHGRPIFSLGAQCHNSSGYSLNELAPFFEVCAKLPLNAVAIPVSWERFEPEEGQYDTGIVRDIISACRERNYALHLIWFGSWKNGHSKYAPHWVRADRERFLRIRNREGVEIANLSPLCEATLQIESAAFQKLMETIKENKEDETVIAVQVENELGMIAETSRDYGEQAEELFYAQVPESVIKGLREAGEDEYIKRAWQACGSPEKGDWQTVLGRYGAEAFSAYNYARYVQHLTQIGKGILDVPFYTNAWLDGQGFDVAGHDYPAGGVVMKNLAIWKWAAPDLAFLCPDMYMSARSFYRKVMDTYARQDNPLFFPETGWGEPSAMNVFEAIAKHSLKGVHVFGLESMVDEGGAFIKDALPIVDSIRALGTALPLLLHPERFLSVQAVYQEEFATYQMLEFDGYSAMASFHPYERKGDFRHMQQNARQGRGCGLVIQTGQKEFVALGCGYTLKMRKKRAMNDLKEDRLHTLPEHYLEYHRVEEGRFDEQGQFVLTRIRNGDQTDFGVFVYPESCVRFEMP